MYLSLSMDHSVDVSIKIAYESLLLCLSVCQSVCVRVSALKDVFRAFILVGNESLQFFPTLSQRLLHSTVKQYFIQWRLREPVWFDNQV